MHFQKKLAITNSCSPNPTDPSHEISDKMEQNMYVHAPLP